MIIEYSDKDRCWLARGEYLGRKFLAEGPTWQAALLSAIDLMREYQNGHG